MKIEYWKKVYPDTVVAYFIKADPVLMYSQNIRGRKEIAAELIAAAEFFLEGIKD